ncbi:hypothetical protein DXG01_006812 [Tephrocybe rancida]|nr:hypothetical protein DXG01_006812 [Tephrocybe rancida]
MRAQHRAPQCPTPKTTATCTSAHRSPHASLTTHCHISDQHDGDDTDHPHRHVSAHNPTRRGHAPLPTARWPPDSPPPAPVALPSAAQAGF